MCAIVASIQFLVKEARYVIIDKGAQQLVMTGARSWVRERIASTIHSLLEAPSLRVPTARRMARRAKPCTSMFQCVPMAMVRECDA